MTDQMKDADIRLSRRLKVTCVPHLTKTWCWANGIAGASIAAIALQSFWIAIRDENAIALLAGCVFCVVFYFFIRFLSWWKNQQSIRSDEMSIERLDRWRRTPPKRNGL